MRCSLFSSLGYAGSALVLVLALLAACSDPAQAQGPAANRVRPLPVHTLTLQAPTLKRAERTYTGIVYAARTVAVGVQIAGQVVEVPVRAGEAVEQGDLLLRLDDRRLQAALRTLDAQIEGAQARLAELEAGPRKETIQAARSAVTALESEKALAELRVTRREQLLEANSGTQEDVDSTRSQVNTLEARIVGAKAQLEELETGTRTEVLAAQRAVLASLQAEQDRLRIDLADTRVLAPFAGRVQTLLVQVGTTVPAGFGAIELVETGALEAHFGLPAAETEGLLEAEAQLEYRGVPLQVVGRRFLPELEAMHRTVTWIFDLVAPEPVEGLPGMLPGSSVRLSLSYPLTQKGWEVPLCAITEGLRGMWTAYLVETDAEGKDIVVPVDLQVLHTGPETAVVRGALAASARLLVDGVDRVVPGQQVEVVLSTEGAR